MAKEQEANQQTFTLADVLAIIQEQNQLNQANLIEAVKELKKPSEAEAKKLADEKIRMERNARSAAEDAKRALARTRAQQESCTHQKPDKTTRWGGQVNGDGRVRFMCNGCFEILPPVVAPEAWKTGGVNTHAAEDIAGGMQLITKQNILSWHVGTVTDCSDPDCPAVKQHAIYRAELDKQKVAVGA